MSLSLCNRIQVLFEQDLNLLVSSFDTDLIDAGLLDSLVFVDLIMKLEQLFEVEIPVAELDIDSFRSIARIADVVTSLQNSSAAAQGSAA